MWSLTVGKALTVDLGMDRGGEACRGVAPGCWIPWVLGVWVSSGDVWLEGVGSESILEVKSPDVLGVFEGRPRLRGAVFASEPVDLATLEGRADLPSSSACG